MLKQTSLHKSFLVLILAGLALCANAENWTRFRGPNGQGHSPEKDLPTKWGTNDYLWEVTLPAAGSSSPVIWEDKLFITCAAKDNRTAHLIAYNTADGKELWKKTYPIEPLKMNRLNSIAAGTPTVDEKHVYALWYGRNETRLVALDHTGRHIWTRNFPAPYLQHGPGSSPIVYQDMVVFTQEQNKSSEQASKWIAVDKHTGKLRWSLSRDPTDQASYSVPCVYTDKDKKDVLIFSSKQHGITAIDPETGKVVWEVKDTLPARVVSSPVISGDLILNTCGSGGGGKQLAIISALATANRQPEITYTSNEKFVPYVSTAIAVDGLFFLYHDQGTITCIESATGNVKWSEEPAGRYYSSPVYADGKLYCMDMDGKVVVLRAKDSYEVLAIMDLSEKTQASIAIANGRIFLRTFTRLLCVGKK